MKNLRWAEFTWTALKTRMAVPTMKRKENHHQMTRKTCEKKDLLPQTQ
jgi:hypothetical protein